VRFQDQSKNKSSKAVYYLIYYGLKEIESKIVSLLHGGVYFVCLYVPLFLNVFE